MRNYEQMFHFFCIKILMHPKWINTSDNPSKYLSLQTPSMRKICLDLYIVL